MFLLRLKYSFSYKITLKSENGKVSKVRKLKGPPRKDSRGNDNFVPLESVTEKVGTNQVKGKKLVGNSGKEIPSKKAGQFSTQGDPSAWYPLLVMPFRRGMGPFVT